MPYESTEIDDQGVGAADGMLIEWDVEIPMPDGTVRRADVFRPSEPGRYPVVMTHGVYGKGLPIERLIRSMMANWSTHAQAADTPRADLADLVETADRSASRDVAPGDYRVWEVVDPSVWVPAGYACVRVDSAGSGSSPGYIDPLCPAEIDDYVACVEWAGTRDWSTGKVGLCGKSYYAMTQWLVAERRPEHLAALCIWHGLSDWYRDATRHGGIMYQFWENFWYPGLVLPVQYGSDGGLNPHSGLPITGEHSFEPAVLAEHRTDIGADIRAHPLLDDYHRERTADPSRINVPVLASADWSDHDLHLRGTIRGFDQVTEADAWLEIHAGGQFDDPGSVDLQRRFLDHHLKGATGDWGTQPRVQVALRRPDGSSSTYATTSWPAPGTIWNRSYVHPGSQELSPSAPKAASSLTYRAEGEGVQLTTAPGAAACTVLGPVGARLFISSSTTDADLFLRLDALDPDGNLVQLRDHRAGLTPLSVGWQRASLRQTDPVRSRPGRPWFGYTQTEPLVPGQVVPVDIEMCPTSLELPAGYRLRLTVRGNGAAHDDNIDRPADIFDNEVTLHAGPDLLGWLDVPTVRGIG